MLQLILRRTCLIFVDLVGSITIPPVIPVERGTVHFRAEKAAANRQRPFVMICAFETGYAIFG